jgi:hypothetical protein
LSIDSLTGDIVVASVKMASIGARYIDPKIPAHFASHA